MCFSVSTTKSSNKVTTILRCPVYLINIFLYVAIDDCYARLPTAETPRQHPWQKTVAVIVNGLHMKVVKF